MLIAFNINHSEQAMQFAENLPCGFTNGLDHRDYILLTSVVAEPQSQHAVVVVRTHVVSAKGQDFLNAGVGVAGLASHAHEGLVHDLVQHIQQRVVLVAENHVKPELQGGRRLDNLAIHLLFELRLPSVEFVHQQFAGNLEQLGAAVHTQTLQREVETVTLHDAFGVQQQEILTGLFDFVRRGAGQQLQFRLSLEPGFVDTGLIQQGVKKQVSTTLYLASVRALQISKSATNRMRSTSRR